MYLLGVGVQGAESAVSTRSDASSQHDVDMNSWEEVGFPCYRGQEASPLRKLHWNMYPLPRTRDGASGQGGSGGDTGELNGDDEDDEEVDSGILDPDAELALSQRGYGLIQVDCVYGVLRGVISALFVRFLCRWACWRACCT